MIQVSIIVLTYNSDWKKLCKTIKSAASQKKIDFEIVVCDDGSNAEFVDHLKEYMQTYDSARYNLIIHKNNVGIVKNYFDGILVAKGKYIYGISPGDYFYNDEVLCNLFSFAEKKSSKIVYGDAVFYKSYDQEGQKVNLFQNLTKPPYDLNALEKPDKQSLEKLLFFDNNIIGATYFRRKESALKYIGEFVDIVKYVEDFTSLSYAIAEGESINHYEGYVIWYEYGDGISTKGNSKWNELLYKDRKNAAYHMMEVYAENKTLKALFTLKYLNRNVEKLVFLLDGHIDILLDLICIKLFGNKHKRKIHRYPIDTTMIDSLYEDK